MNFEKYPGHKCVFSADRQYRYSLWREWGDVHGPDNYLNVIGLNPSTADETKDDPTIRRCIDFGKRWGFAGLCMTNIFAFRSTDPAGLWKVADPAGPENLANLVPIALEAGLVLAAWGKSLTIIKPRAEFVMGVFNATGVKLHCLRKNKDGSPQHPLYVPAITQAIPYP